MKIYKIKDTKTGKYYAGGDTGKLTKHGKTWSNIAHVKNALHNLNCIKRGLKTNVFKENINNWIVEEYELIEPSKKYDMLTFLSDDNPKKEYEILSNLL